MPRRATCTAPKFWWPRPGGCSETTASAAWPPSSAATGSISAGSRSTTASTAAGSRHSTTICDGRCSRSRFASSLMSSATIGRSSSSSTASTRSSTPSLARHYGMPVPAGGPDDGSGSMMPTRYGRGGLLPMSVFLTKNSPGLRTSPVKRGYWVVRRLLGENIPAPPPNVPDLPDDEAKLGDLTLRQTLARHRADKAAPAATSISTRSGWPSKGTARWAKPGRKDLGGQPVDTRATFPGGGEGLDSRGSARTSRPTARRVRRQPLPQAAGLRPRAEPDPVGRRDHRGHAPGSTATATASAAWSKRSSPAPSSGTSECQATRRRDDAMSGSQPTRTRPRRPSRGIPPDVPPRRRRHDGLALARIDPRLGRGRVAGGAAPCPKRFAALFMGCGVNPDDWWAKGSGDDDGAGPLPGAAGAAEGQDQRDQRPVQQARHRRGDPPRADRQHPFRRSAFKREPS